ncbi:hypothetical protein DFH06DRAFT_1423948 [Mycena polygramma]|nr:hypothetical protein DFH06DRAFT_1423948 [Mycena polygramma]
MKLSTLLLAIQSTLLSNVVDAQTISPAGGGVNGSDVTPFADESSASNTTTSAACGLDPAGCSSTAVTILGVVSLTQTVSSALATSSDTINATDSVTFASPSPAVFASPGTTNSNSPVTTETTAIGKNSPTPQPVLIGIIIGLSLLAVIAAAVVFLLMRMLQRRSSKPAVDPEVAPFSAEGIRVACADAIVTPAAARNPELAESIPYKLAQLENQARAVQREIDSLRHANQLSNKLSGTECVKGYSGDVNVAQKQKFDSLAARARELTTCREPDSSEDELPPGYKQFEPSSSS